jgi:hypothetical protein
MKLDRSWPKHHVWLKSQDMIARTAVDLVGRIDLRERAAHGEVLEQDAMARLVIPLLLRASMGLKIR